jgi:hypothetical protein
MLCFLIFADNLLGRRLCCKNNSSAQLNCRQPRRSNYSAFNPRISRMN